MPLIDITVPLGPETPRWPGSPGFGIRTVVKDVSGFNITGSTVNMDIHCGTHLDAPLHYLSHGAPIDETDLESCIGPAFVGDFRGVRKIDAKHLEERVPPGTARLLLKTDNSERWKDSSFAADFAALTTDGAQWLADERTRLIGNDYMSIQLFGGDPLTHTVLMESGVVILEGVDLSDVDPGHYDLICLPMRISGAEGAPARAVLVTREVNVSG